MSEYYVCTSPDWDNNVVDVTIVIDGEPCWVKGFDDTECKEADAYAQKIAEKLGLEFVGDVEFPD